MHQMLITESYFDSNLTEVGARLEKELRRQTDLKRVDISRVVLINSNESENPEKMAKWARIMEDSADKKTKNVIKINQNDEIIEREGLDGIEDISNKMLEIDS